ncbi:MAG: L,D-transpeptidase [Deltaproteobacteria bacterium]|jgi:hypothetical protein|nr:L,D-transpeptidase [Deltaproteobacteria bacterium]
MKKRVIEKIYKAVGGPSVAKMGGDGYKAGPTDAGKYVIAYCGRHSSRLYADWSKIRWGSSIKEENGKIFVYHNNRWQHLSKLTTLGREDILDYHEELYGTRIIPKKWVFNDFGHQTCYFFKDLNKNRRLDKNKGEKIHSEFIHPTPNNEASSARGLPVILTESHGCIHVKPKDIDEMSKKGYLKAGNIIIIHKYNEIAPIQPIGQGNPPYQVHFYPNSQRLVIYGVKK